MIFFCFHNTMSFRSSTIVLQLSREVALLQVLIEKSRHQHRHQPFQARMNAVLRLSLQLLFAISSEKSTSRLIPAVCFQCFVSLTTVTVDSRQRLQYCISGCPTPTLFAPTDLAPSRICAAIHTRYPSSKTVLGDWCERCGKRNDCSVFSPNSRFQQTQCSEEKSGQCNGRYFSMTPPWTP